MTADIILNLFDAVKKHDFAYSEDLYAQYAEKYDFTGLDKIQDGERKFFKIVYRVVEDGCIDLNKVAELYRVEPAEWLHCEKVRRAA